MLRNQVQRRRNRVRPRERVQGYLLIEVLIAVCLFSLGVLALVGAQASMSKSVTEAKLRSEASFLANQLIGQMWVDQANIARYISTSGECEDAYARCTNWQSQVAQLLPSGSADVGLDGSEVTLSLQWQLPGESPSRFEISANITQ